MDELTLKIRDLRSRLKNTQQAFANRLRVSLRAVANYESGRRPARAVLWNLAIIASKTGHQDRPVFKMGIRQTTSFSRL